MTVAVVDASAITDILTGSPPGQQAGDQMRRASALVAPAHLDAEVFSALARMLRSGELDGIGPHLIALADLPVERYPVAPLLAAAVQLLGNVAAKDALYVALAQAVGGWLITTDERLRRAAAGLVGTDAP